MPRRDRDEQNLTTIMSRLPQELIDDIIDCVDPWDTHTLRAFSLVCTQWSVRSRKHLFREVELYSRTDLERWCAHIRPGPSGPSPLVEDLSLVDNRLSMSLPDASCIQPSILSNAAAHLQSFSGVRALRIMGWDTFTVKVSLMLHHLGPLPQNVTRLALEHIYIHPPTFTTFVSHFPRLHDLSIFTLKRPRGAGGIATSNYEAHSTIVPNHPRGEFSSDMSSDELEKVFGGIVLLEPRFRRVTIKYARYNQWRIFWPIVEACAGSLEEFEISLAVSIGE